MNLLKNTLASMIGIGFLIASAYGLYYAVQCILGAFAGLEAMQKQSSSQGHLPFY